LEIIIQKKFCQLFCPETNSSKQVVSGVN
jgi:hypothetical protein